MTGAHLARLPTPVEGCGIALARRLPVAYIAIRTGVGGTRMIHIWIAVISGIFYITGLYGLALVVMVVAFRYLHRSSGRVARHIALLRPGVTENRHAPGRLDHTT
jgi:hypothetical protein